MPINPCAHCLDGDLLISTASFLEVSRDTITGHFERAWNTNQELIGELKAQKIDETEFVSTQSQQMFLVGEMGAIIDAAIKDATELECSPDACVGNKVCPKILALAGVRPQLDKILDSFPEE